MIKLIKSFPVTILAVIHWVVLVFMVDGMTIDTVFGFYFLLIIAYIADAVIHEFRREKENDNIH